MKNKNIKNDRSISYASLFTMGVLLVFISGCNMSVNKDIAVDNGKRVGNSQNSVNGNMTINWEKSKNCAMENENENQT